MAHSLIACLQGSDTFIAPPNTITKYCLYCRALAFPVEIDTKAAWCDCLRRKSCEKAFVEAP